MWEDMFDDIAWKRWGRKGHASGPEPPSLVGRHSSGGKLFPAGLTGLVGDFCRREGVALAIMCFRKPPAARGLAVPDGVANIRVQVTDSRYRDTELKKAMAAFECTAAYGESTVVHCAAGVHRAPLVAALLKAAPDGSHVHAAIAEIEQLRNVEFSRTLKETPLKAWFFAAAQAHLRRQPVAILTWVSALRWALGGRRAR